jgi:hypothetical protein
MSRSSTASASPFEAADSSSSFRVAVARVRSEVTSRNIKDRAARSSAPDIPASVLSACAASAPSTPPSARYASHDSRFQVRSRTSHSRSAQNWRSASAAGSEATASTIAQIRASSSNAYPNCLAGRYRVRASASRSGVATTSTVWL